MDKAKKLVIQNSEERIVTLALEGLHIPEIAAAVGMTDVTVRKHLDTALEIAKLHYQENSAKLLAKTYLRTENLIDKLSREAFDTLEDGREVPRLNVIDRITRLLEVQNKILSRAQPITVKHQGDADNPIQIEATFSTGSKLYDRALQMAQEDPSLLIIEQTNNIFEDSLNEYSEV